MTRYNYEYETKPRGHKWKLNDYNGGIDIFAYEGHHCNGPECIKCGYSFCQHCTKGKALQNCTR